MNNSWTLYHYWRSSSSWRVRWALELKRQKVNFVHVDLLNGESESAEHLKRNPLGFVPALTVGNRTLIESVAIVEWLEEKIPAPRLYPGDAFDRAQIRALVEIINADTQPIQNLTVMDKYSEDPEKRKEWNQYFIKRGLSAYEKLAGRSAGRFSFGDQITAADLLLIPQCYNAKRFEVDLSTFPLISGIFERALSTPEAVASHPDRFKV